MALTMSQILNCTYVWLGVDQHQRLMVIKLIGQKNLLLLQNKKQDV